ncbi:hypothetical protein K525DRAFT_215143, partial [Schizophyllum commune Loenen D]
IDRRFCRCPLRYFVRWSGYKGTDEETSWVAASDLTHCQELVNDFHRLHPSKPSPSS